MATWGEVERELLANLQPDGAPDFDKVRRNYLGQLAEYSGRSVIVYETAGFAPKGPMSPDDIQISLDPDVGAFMEVVHGLPRDVAIDLILHSPGGTAEAAEAIVEYLRGRFPGLRVIVPVAAMSAATMMAMAADEIVLGAHSQVGPIDPQLTIATPEGPRTAPATAIRQQFMEAQQDLATNPQHTAAWLPILRSLAPALLQICEDAEKLSKSMVTEWLTRYMLKGDRTTAEHVADELSKYEKHMSHARRIGFDQLKELGLKVVRLEDDQTLQDLVLSVHHAINHTMGHTGMVKIVENHLGKAYIRRVGNVGIAIGPVQPGQPPAQSPMPPGATRPGLPAGAPANRQQRRQEQRKRGR